MESEDVLFEKKEHHAVITFNRPKKYNSVLASMYGTMTSYLKSAEDDDAIKYVAIKGNGKYFTAGADFVEAFVNPHPPSNEINNGSKKFSKFQKFVECLICFSKPLIAVVQGPAVGVGVTMLPHCDVIVASTKATFHTPFSSIGIVPEACSSVTFANIMGPSMASDMLLFNRKLTSNEAYECGLVSRLVPHESFDQTVEAMLDTFDELPIKSLVYGKELMKNHQRELLLKKNEEECTRLAERFRSGDVQKQAQKLLAAKMKAKNSKL